MDSRRGLQMWGPLGRWVFLNWPRGSWQYDLICGAIIAGLFILPSPPTTPQMGLDEVLAAIETADASVNSFTADMTSTEHIAMFDDDEIEVGTVEFLKPNFFRRDVTEPGPSTYTIADGQVTVYLPRIRQAQIISLESAEEGGDEAAVVVPGLNSSAELKSAYDVSLDGVGEEDGSRVYRIRLIPHEGTTPAKHYQSIVLHVVEGEWHPARRIVMENYSGDTTTVELSNVVRNAELSPDDFRLELPPGTEIINQIRRGPTN